MPQEILIGSKRFKLSDQLNRLGYRFNGDGEEGCIMSRLWSGGVARSPEK